MKFLQRSEDEIYIRLNQEPYSYTGYFFWKKKQSVKTGKTWKTCILIVISEIIKSISGVLLLNDFGEIYNFSPV